jgi:Ca2+-binding EF-hand superfamily protein
MGCCADKPKRKGEGNDRVDDGDIDRKLDDIYRRYDINGDGSLNRDETRKFLNDVLKNSNQTVSDSELDNFIQQADNNRDGKIQKQEIFDLYKKMNRNR